MDTDTNIRDKLIRVMHRMRRETVHIADALDPSPGEFMALMRVLKCGGGPELSVSDIQGGLNVSKPAVSQILNTLEKKKLILRSIDASDRRKISVTLTQDGERTLERAKLTIDSRMDEFIERFGRDDALELIRLADKLFYVLDEMRNNNK